MSAQRRTQKRTDPVGIDQGGRLMQHDPLASPNAPAEEVVRRKAYEIYEQRGRTHGHDVDDWLTAESQVRA